VDLRVRGGEAPQGAIVVASGSEAARSRAEASDGDREAGSGCAVDPSRRILMSEKIGRLCEKHGQWCADGTCPLCESEAPVVQILPDRATAIALQKGDALVLEHDRRITTEMHESIRAQVEKMYPGVKVVILDGGIKLAAVLKAVP
jgi:hypothetical protein